MVESFVNSNYTYCLWHVVSFLFTIHDLGTKWGGWCWQGIYNKTGMISERANTYFSLISDITTHTSENRNSIIKCVKWYTPLTWHLCCELTSNVSWSNYYQKSLNSDHIYLHCCRWSITISICVVSSVWLLVLRFFWGYLKTCRFYSLVLVF